MVLKLLLRRWFQSSFSAYIFVPRGAETVSGKWPCQRGLGVDLDCPIDDEAAVRLKFALGIPEWQPTTSSPSNVFARPSASHWTVERYAS